MTALFLSITVKQFQQQAFSIFNGKRPFTTCIASSLHEIWPSLPSVLELLFLIIFSFSSTEHESSDILFSWIIGGLSVLSTNNS